MKTGSNGLRAAGGTPETHPLETLALWLLGGMVAIGALLWLTGQLSGRLFGGAWPPARASEMASVVIQYPKNIGDPAQAWPTHARSLVPGPVEFYATFAALVLPALAAAIGLSARRAGRGTDPGPSQRSACRSRAEAVRDRHRADADGQDHWLRDPRDPRMAGAGGSDFREDRPSS